MIDSHIFVILCTDMSRKTAVL